MNFKQDKPQILNLVNQAHEGKCVIPEFQRSFVWEYTDVVDFLNSIFKGLYIGSILTLECDADSTPFAFRPVEGVNLNLESCEPQRMLLDGQQRITTLHYIFYAPENVCLKNTKYPYKFYLKLDHIEDEDLTDKAIFGDRVDHCDKWKDEENQFKTRIVPFTVLKSTEEWNRWLNEYEMWLMNQGVNSLVEFKRTKREVWARVIDNLQLQTIPIVELDEIDADNKDQISEVCAIFEKINSSGVRLSVFELLTARLYKYDINLRNLWNTSIEKYSKLFEYSDGDTGQYGIFILRIICLLRGIDAKRREIIGLKPERFLEDWEIAAEYLNKAIDRVGSTTESGFGGFTESWIPYPPMLPALAALLYKIDENKFDHYAYKVIKKWYWGSVFGERYSSGIESKTTADYKSIFEHLLDHNKPIKLFYEIDSGITNNPAFNLDEESRGNAKYKGVMCLLALNGAKDFRIQDTISLHDLDDHHIFPKAYLDEILPGIKDSEKNIILNRTLIKDITNRKIGRLAPSDYMINEEIIEQQNKHEILGRHFINHEAAEALLNNDYQNFIKLRQEEILKKLRNLLSI